MDRNTIETRVTNYWLKACELYPVLKNYTQPYVEYFSKGVKAGQANIRTNKVLFNEVLAVENGEAFDDTISHEVAHIVQYHLYPRSQPHGAEFKRIHRALGGTGNTYHSYNVASVKRYRKGSKVFTCGCNRKIVLTPERSLSAIVYKNIVCTKCKSKVEYLGGLELVKGLSHV